VRLGFVEKADKKYEYKVMPLLLNHFKSLFYIQIMSFILTLIVFIFEIMHFRFKTKKQRYRKVCCIKYKNIFRKMIGTVMSKAKIISRHKIKEKVLRK
jgi:tellurite resistance protein TehA-like permease